uniref:JmjC domain-containing protein n=1 Tax=viral metagenome TaxID=1070528 RepID=A0A6C0KTX2_9ZZZZ
MKLKNVIISIILLIIFFIIAIVAFSYYYVTLDINNNRHLTRSYNYAHFSKINSWNYFLFPSLLLTSPKRYVLREGESLFIPKKWWHWIVTPTKTTAINFWFEHIIASNVPAKINDLYNFEDQRKIYEQIIQYIKEEQKHYIWDSSNHFGSNGLLYSGEAFLNEDKNNRYLLTLAGYGSNLNNENIKKKLTKWIELPDVLKTSAINQEKPVIDINLWISSNYHDTGLHYDDNDGILYVLKGEKHITLFPPNDSKYLVPYDITPNYAKVAPLFMKYNEYYIVKENSGLVPCKVGNSNSRLPCEMILYQSLICFAKYTNVLTTVQKIYDNKSDPLKKLVWGCKKQDDVYRWEIYNYHYDQYNNTIINKTDWRAIVLNENSISRKIAIIMNNKKTIINSIDILNSVECLNNQHHSYEMCKNMTGLILPFYGNGYDIINNKKQKVSTFIYDNYESLIKNGETYCCELKLDYNNKVKELLQKYRATDMCLWNKKGDYFIQWLGISIDDFIHFLVENHYGQCFINHIIENRNKYEYLAHEITIVYDKVSLSPYRSGFYGCL